MEWDSARFAGAMDKAGRTLEHRGIRWTPVWAAAEKEGTMHAEARRMNGPQAHPVAELLACPPELSALLTVSAQTLEFQAGDTVFRQGQVSRGLYLVVAGQLLRRSDRMETRIVLGQARPGDLIELAATLGDGRHTYSLIGQSGGSLLLLPADSLEKAFATYPPLRMRLLEELAREVSRAYVSMAYTWTMRKRRRAHGSEMQ